MRRPTILLIWDTVSLLRLYKTDGGDQYVWPSESTIALMASALSMSELMAKLVDEMRRNHGSFFRSSR